MQKIGRLEVVKYQYELVDGDPKIVISMIKLLDTEGKYIKFCRLKDVEPFLSKFPINFKPLN